MTTKIVDQLTDTVRRNQAADKQRQKDDFMRASDLLEGLEQVLSRAQSDQTLGMCERRLSSLASSVKARLSITKGPA